MKRCPISLISKLILILLAALSLTACGFFSSNQAIKDGPPLHYVNVNKIPNAKPKYLPKSRYGNPRSYVALGKRYYVLSSAVGYNKRGIASWYGRKFQGKLTSSREPYNMLAMTAASPVLPIPCFVRVTNLENGRDVIVKVNDRGPFAPNRIIDLSYAAAKKLGYARKGTALVQVTTIDPRHPYEAPPVVLTKHPQLYLQIGAFRDYANAEHLKSEITRMTRRPVRIQTANYRLRPIYRVQIGPLVGVGESDKLHGLLEQEGFGNAITVIG